MPASSALLSVISCQPSWLVSPASPGLYRQPPPMGSWARTRIPDRPADRLAEPRVAGHSVGLAQGAGRHRVAVHELERGRLAAEIAVRRLDSHQIFEAAANVFAVGAVEMRVAGSEERQQRQSGHGACRPCRRRLRGLGPHVGLACRRRAFADPSGRRPIGCRPATSGRPSRRPRFRPCRRDFAPRRPDRAPRGVDRRRARLADRRRRGRVRIADQRRRPTCPSRTT